MQNTMALIPKAKDRLYYPGQRKRPLFFSVPLPVPPEPPPGLNEDPRSEFQRLLARHSTGAVLRLEKKIESQLRIALPNVALSAFGTQPTYDSLVKLLRGHLGTANHQAAFYVDWFQSTDKGLKQRGGFCVRFGRAK